MFSSTSAPSGTIACLRFTSAIVRPSRRKRSSMCFITASFRTSLRPSNSATASRVKSSCVGPSPPLAITSSTRPSAPRKASFTSSFRSPTTVLRVTTMPRRFNWPVRNSELVSVRSGVSSSEPTAMISAFMILLLAPHGSGSFSLLRCRFRSDVCRIVLSLEYYPRNVAPQRRHIISYGQIMSRRQISVARPHSAVL